MKTTGQIVDINFDFATGKPKVTLLLEDKQNFLNGIDEIRGEKLAVGIETATPQELSLLKERWN